MALCCGGTVEPDALAPKASVFPPALALVLSWGPASGWHAGGPASPSVHTRLPCGAQNVWGARDRAPGTGWYNRLDW